MSNLFEAAIDQAKGVSEQEQDRIARFLLAELQLIELRRQMRENGICIDIGRQRTIVF